MMPKNSILISSPPDRELLVAEIFQQNEQWAELNQEQEKLTVEIYPNQHEKAWVFEFDELIAILTEAKQRLVGR